MRSIERRLFHLLWVLVPAVLVGGFEYVRHGFFHTFPVGLGNLLAALTAFAGSALYYALTYQVIRRLEAGLRAERERQAVLEERERIADALHDSVAQSLFFLNVRLRQAETLLQEGRGEPAADLLKEARTSVQETYEEVRKTLRSLTGRPPQQPLPPALDAALAALERETGITVQREAAAADLADLPAETSQAVLDIVQEALHNIRKHARARRVVVRAATAGGTLTVEVTDDGAGLPPDAEQRGFGLQSMRRRAERLRGSLELASQPGAGTSIRLRLPVSPGQGVENRSRYPEKEGG